MLICRQVEGYHFGVLHLNFMFCFTFLLLLFFKWPMFCTTQTLLSRAKFNLSTKISLFWKGSFQLFGLIWPNINYFSKLVANRNDVNKLWCLRDQQYLESKALVFIDIFGWEIRIWLIYKRPSTNGG